jgi:hypothetical protein
MFRKLAGLTAIAGLFIAGTAGAGTLEGSAHDFSDNANRFAQTGDAWSSENNANGELCIVCHAPHNNQNEYAVMEPQFGGWSVHTLR